jgi:hypothetical protein
MKRRAVFTICCKNYLAFAKTLLESLKNTNSDVDRYLVLCERENTINDKDGINCEVILAQDLDIARFKEMSYAYSVVELNTCIKPAALKRILALGYDEVIYLDPDIKVYGRLDPLWPSICEASIILTPHLTQPCKSNLHNFEINTMQMGIYNLGFLGVSASNITKNFLEWWDGHCQYNGFDYQEKGLFVDQKFCDLVPAIFESVFIAKHMGANVAYWNLHERGIAKHGNIIKINGEFPLIFFHYSGIEVGLDYGISKHLNGLSIKDRPDLEMLFSEYRNDLRRNNQMKYANEPYSFERRKDGSKIHELDRLVFTASNFDRLGNSASEIKCETNKIDAGGYICNCGNQRINQVRLKTKKQSILASKLIFIGIKTMQWIVGPKLLVKTLYRISRYSHPRIITRWL